MGRALIAGVIIAAWLALAGAAQAQDRRPMLAADASQTGYVNLVSFGEADTKVQFFERVGDDLEPRGSGVMDEHGVFYVLGATTWRCDRLVRSFLARMVEPGGEKRSGSFTLRTPSCRHRLSLEAPTEVQPGEPFTVRLIDEWGIGAVPAKVCARFEGEPEVCGDYDIARGTRQTEQELRLPRSGVWTLRARLGRYSDAIKVGVGVPAPAVKVRPVVLTTGDSTIQGVEGYLSDRLPRRVKLVRQYQVGSGISRPVETYFPYWPSQAQRQAQEKAPHLTVISIGAIDGFPMDVPGAGQVHCCSEEWIAEYSRRVGEMMDAYGRGGEGRVLWLTLPAPRQKERARNSAAVNEAIRRAASGRGHVRLVQLDRTFTPGFEFRKRMRYHGKRVRVRERDGIHLTAKGTEIAARAVAYAVRNWPGSLP